jgi:hypothetical protein
MTPTPLFFPHCTVYCPFGSGITTISILQNISRLYAAASAALAPMSPHSHLRRPDFQRQRYHQLPCPHEEFRNRSWAHRWVSEEGQWQGHVWIRNQPFPIKVKRRHLFATMDMD